MHTPLSLVQNYGGDQPEIWQRFIGELAALPPEFKVIGINDYLFLDGYRKVLAAKQANSLPNIDLILPVIEFRLDKFAGTDGEMSRVNFHVIFSNELSPDVIEQQFLNALAAHYVVDSRYPWQAVLSRESLTDLGQKIINATPEDKRAQLGSPLKVGFNNFCLRSDQVLKLLENPTFAGKHLIAIGRAEWSQIRWDGAGTAEKRTLIERSDFVFTSAKTIDAYNTSRSKLKLEQVNDRLLDCSDAHFFKGADQYNQIGKCFTWIKADSTFEGLKQLKIEFDERAWIGELPHQIVTTRSKPTRFIDTVKIDKTPGSDLKETWFHQTLEFNPGLVAIIGNRGSGKSALADTLGLLGHTRHADKFSFLTDSKFCQQKQNKGRHFTATVKWLSGAEFSAQLDAAVPGEDVELVKYIPQNFLEDVCNEIGRPEESEFDRELKAVIFSHVREADRLGKTSLDDLIKFKTQETFDALGLLVGTLHDLNRKISELEVSSLDENRKRLDNALKARQADLLANATNKPAEVLPPDAGDAQALQLNEKAAGLDEQLISLGAERRLADEKLSDVTLKTSLLTKVSERTANAKRQHEEFSAAIRADASAIGLTVTDLLTITFHQEPLDRLRQEFATALAAAKEKLAELEGKIKVAEAQLAETRAAMAGPAKLYQAYLAALKKWQEEQNGIIGDEHTPGAIKALEAELKQLGAVPEAVAQLHRTRLDTVRAIFSKIKGLAKAYQDLYTPVQEFISQHPIVKDKIQLNFDASIIDVGFREKFFEFVNQGSSGSFCGKDEGNRVLKALLDPVDWGEEEQVISFLSSIFDHLTHDLRAGKKEKEGEPPKSVELRPQLRKGKSALELYDFICSLNYLRPRYTLRVRERELHEMSPGERGILLLIFFLLIDFGDSPLIIDQPEENLDNQTIFNLLVPAIRDAKKRRQIVIVTHNPNLAVVCDADQIIAASIDKANSNTITYLSGALENPAINRRVLDILEGTQPAFKNRDSKYQFSPR